MTVEPSPEPIIVSDLPSSRTKIASSRQAPMSYRWYSS